MTYSISLNTGVVTRDADGVVIEPTSDVSTQDYIEYLAWLNAGNESTVLDVQVPVQPPIIVTPRQIRLALNASGLRDAVEAAVAQSDQSVKDTWDFSTEIQRDNPLIIEMGTTLGMTEADVDALFELAARL